MLILQVLVSTNDDLRVVLQKGLSELTAAQASMPEDHPAPLKLNEHKSPNLWERLRLRVASWLLSIFLKEMFFVN